MFAGVVYWPVVNLTKSFVFYLLVLVVFGSGLALTLEEGRKLPAAQAVAPSLQPDLSKAGGVAGVEPSASLLANVRENLQDPLTRLLIQVILIVLAARVCGVLAARMRQPFVVGEMVAGILLGPSLLGWLWPGLFHFVFPAPSLGALRLLSQIGVCLFMFVVGMELDVSRLKEQARTAVLVSQVSILLPFLLGVVMSLYLYSTLAGVVMPSRGQFRDFFKVRLEHFSAAFLLPLFFAFTGLRTQVGLLSDAGGWLLCAALIAIATLGKLGGTMLTARLTGVNWIDSFALGALINTRGLVELIALNIGYDMGILSPRIFTMLVIMALVTTGLTGPFLTLSDYLRAQKSLAANPA